MNTVVAITQHNVVKLEDVSLEIGKKLNLTENSTVAVIHPILSRNRFSMMLKAIAKTVPQGKVIKDEFDKDIEVIIYGDGAYKNPESGIFELADPVSCFGCTQGIKNRNRIGVKTKYLMQKLHNEGRSRDEIERIIEEEGRKFAEKQDKQGFNAQGTTPRKIENLVSSLADLVSGSGDTNTPIVIVRGFV